MSKSDSKPKKAKHQKASSTAVLELDSPATQKPVRAIEIHGARQHNLKNISVSMPQERLTVITGPSGSGKSSLAFDTLFAEGQRRFLESLSTYARQFMTRFEKPDVDQILNILPAIALEQKNAIKNARSTVGTVTEIDDFLRLLYATLGVLVDESGEPIAIIDSNSILRRLLEMSAESNGLRVIITAPVCPKETPYDVLQNLGYFRELTATHAVLDIDKATYAKQKYISVVIDRVVLSSEPDIELSHRLLDSLRKAQHVSPKRIEVFVSADAQTYTCHGFDFTELDAKLLNPSPHLFSFNSPIGACTACEGYGRVIGLDLDKVIPNRSLSLAEGAIHPFNTPSNIELYESLLLEASKRKIPINKPFNSLTTEQKAFVLKGGGTYEGVHPFFEWLETKKYKMHVRVLLSKYRSYTTCYACSGSRLKPESLRFLIDEKSIGAMQALPISQLLAFCESYRVSDSDWPKVKRLFREIKSRLDYLNNIGLGYLTLSRQSRTLSGGEAQRIHLATALGSQLTDTLYVLDEPTVGLHAKDTEQLLVVLKKLRDAGNTVVVVEHDSDMILGADTIIELGPDGGSGGGYLVHQGNPQSMLACAESKTGYFLQKPVELEIANKSQQKDSGSFSIIDATGHNLKNLTVTFPKNRFVCVSGVSGSGKSTLIKQTLYANYQQQRGRELGIESCWCTELEGVDEFEEVVLVDQSPPGRSARSNPATYVKAYDEIRKLLSSTREAKLYGITASDFSFNTVGGRCERCEGLGYLEIDMQFMADVTVTCTDCSGRRFTPSVLAIEWEGKNIDALLNLTIEDAADFFASEKRIVSKLQPLLDVGLGYLKLGQSTATLSGGEAQRLKLSSYLAECVGDGSAQKSLLLFDEPSTGLHLCDIERLIDVFKKLVAEGHSLVVIEHNIDVLIHADYLIDMGPVGGEAGGEVVACGTVLEVISNSHSITGVYLSQRMGRNTIS